MDTSTHVMQLVSEFNKKKPMDIKHRYSNDTRHLGHIEGPSRAIKSTKAKLL